MNDLTLDEQLFLLSRDPQSGRDRSSMGIDTPLAGAVLIVLAEAGAITITDGRVHANTAATVPRPHLQAALDLIASEGRPRKPSHWLRRLPGALRLQETIGLALAGRGVVRDDRGSVLGFTLKRFPDTGPEPRAGIAARVSAALTGKEPDPSTRLLAGLVGAADLVKTLVRRSERRAAGKAAKAYLREVPVGGAVADAVAAAQTAVIAAIAVSVSSSSSGGGGGDDGGGGA